MNSSGPKREGPPSSQVPKIALVLMLAVVIAYTLVALYANVQRLRRDKIEAVTVTPAASPSATPP